MQTRKSLYLIGIILNIVYMGFAVLIALIYGLIGITANPIVGVVLLVIFLVPLVWTIPMTLAANKAYKQIGTEEEVTHIALSVCTLLFVNLVSGILFIVASVMLTDEQDKIKLENKTPVE
ncbi:unknown transmembrane protein [Mesoplasma florum L1]|uniref:Uncharacterized protein n=1 Tax=Mesoplasma florum (strain ATCC 33453 / NBRC 100688 / NCTC 11704 / L1) TaxID=265311 RepID=Q6F0J6_MESFL|nr:hypothetical protein [Mesoplasma florum]AAT75977.1 unknown transmembrane protein [Mesoplasma florum L1]